MTDLVEDTAGDPESAAESLAATFTGPRRLRWLMPLFHRGGPEVAGRVMAVAALGQSLVRERRLARAIGWAAANGYSGWERYRVALATVANHGRYVAQEALIGLDTFEALRATSTIVGGEHLDAVRGGLLIGLHLGPPRSWLYLHAHGYPVRFAIRDTAGSGQLWDRWGERDLVIPLPLGDAASRVQRLYRLRRLLASGARIFITADGPVGTTLFTLDVAGIGVPIRTGWFTLRRQLKVPTVPTLVHEEGERRIVTIHPPLPPVADDEMADRQACHAVLADLVQQYVRAHPTQCRYFAFCPWT